MSHRGQRRRRARQLGGFFFTGILGILLLQQPMSATAGDCQLAKIAELPVTMDGLRPTTMAKINGEDALFAIDSGAFWSMLTPAAAAQYKLRVDHHRLPAGFRVIGIGGSSDAAVANVNTFTIFNVPVRNVEFIVAGNEVGQSAVGLLGQNILRIADIEYDLGDGKLRLFEIKHCSKTNLAYWRNPGDPFSMMEIEPTSPVWPHIVGTGYLNGAKLRVTFDSGAPTSIVATRSAAKAGIKPDSPGVQPAGTTYGVGHRRVETWTATFPSLTIGNEEIHNAKLRFGDLGELDMLLGMDFFLSHRIYVSTSQNRLFFTYNGGPVFSLKHTTAAGKTESSGSQTNGGDGTAPPPPAASSPASPLDAEINPTTPTDAAGFSRRGGAFAARQDLEQALQDFNRACELAPNEPSYFYQRALVESKLQQHQQAVGDIDKALQLNPEYIDALMIRAQIRLHDKDNEGAAADLDAVDRLVPKEADIRHRLAGLYEEADRLPSAIEQLNLWIKVRPDDINRVSALNGRCWDRALLGQELELALKDCDAALRLKDNTPTHDSRGLVHLRRGEYAKAIADYDAVLKINPKAAWSLYGRGLAEKKIGKTTAGEADIAAAMAVNPQIAERAKKYGIGE